MISLSLSEVLSGFIQIEVVWVAEGEAVAEEEENDRKAEDRGENDHPQCMVAFHLGDFSQQQDAAAEEYEGMKNVERGPRHNG